MAVLQGGAARRLGARGAEVAARGALALTPASFLSVALAALPTPPLLAPITWLWIGLILFALCKKLCDIFLFKSCCQFVKLMTSNYIFISPNDIELKR